MAKPGFDELQVTWLLMSRVLPSLNKPTAVSVVEVPCASMTLPCLIVIETKLPVFTVICVFPLTPPEVAVIVAFPDLRAVAAPLTVIEATVFGDVLQVTVLVMSWVVPSENVPVAVNC